MTIDLTYKEICLVVQSIRNSDWTYCVEDETAKSVIQKCKIAIGNSIKNEKKLKF